MSIKRIVNTEFWKDDIVIDNYSVDDKYFFLYLLTNPNSKLCGIYHLPIKTISFETGFSVDVVKVLLERFQNKYHNIVYSYETNEIAILNYIKHSIVKGGKPVEDCLTKELQEVKNKYLIAIVFQHLKDFFDEKEKENSNIYSIIYNIFNNIINIYNINDYDYDSIVPPIVPRLVPRLVPRYGDTDKSKTAPDTAKLDELFSAFWKAYPKKKNKGDAEKWFKKNKPSKELVDIMITQINRSNKTEQWQKNNGQFVPYPATWLNAKGWEDEFLTEAEAEEEMLRRIEEKNKDDS